MNAQRTLTRNESGSTLVVVMVLALALMISTLAVLEFGTQDASLARRDVQTARAFYLAEAGLERAVSWLEAQSTFPTSAVMPFGEEPTILGDGDYFAEVYIDSVNSTATRPAYVVRSTGTAGGKMRVLEVDVAPQSFADFLYFTDIEHEVGGGTPCWFISSDEIDGPLHTNDQISIFGDPVFRDDVTSAYGGPDDSNTNHNAMFLYYNGDVHNHIESPDPSNAPHDNPTFESGYELGDTMIEMPNVLADLQDLAEAGGVVLVTLTGGYDVVMSRPDDVTGEPMYGYVSYRLGNQPWTDLDLTDINGMIYIKGGANVSGTLDGRLTIASTSNMYITDDITYRGSDENGPLPDCDDILGLVSGSDIILENNTPNQSDLEIHAAMMALNTSIRADGYNVGDPRGTLTIYGGLVQQVRGAVGTGYLDENGEAVILTGYAKDYHYDYRLRELPPPGFFQTGTYKELAWRDVGTYVEEG